MESFGANLIIVYPAPPNITGARSKAGSGASLTLSDSEGVAQRALLFSVQLPKSTLQVR